MTIEIINKQKSITYIHRYENVPATIAKAVKNLLDGCADSECSIVSSEYEEGVEE